MQRAMRGWIGCLWLMGAGCGEPWEPSQEPNPAEWEALPEEEQVFHVDFREASCELSEQCLGSDFQAELHCNNEVLVDF